MRTMSTWLDHIQEQHRLAETSHTKILGGLFLEFLTLICEEPTKSPFLRIVVIPYPRRVRWAQAVHVSACVVQRTVQSVHRTYRGPRLTGQQHFRLVLIDGNKMMMLHLLCSQTENVDPCTVLTVFLQRWMCSRVTGSCITVDTSPLTLRLLERAGMRTTLGRYNATHIYATQCKIQCHQHVHHPM